VQTESRDDRRRLSLDVRTPVSAVVQYGVAYAVGLPVFVLYRIGRRLRPRRDPSYRHAKEELTRYDHACPRH
jgi:hypothetical protein